MRRQTDSPEEPGPGAGRREELSVRALYEHVARFRERGGYRFGQGERRARRGADGMRVAGAERRYGFGGREKL
jgi:hypothetical protein